MKVLLIDVNCEDSSTGKIVYDTYNYIIKNNDQAAVCYGRGKKIKENNIFKFGIDIETYLHALLTRITGFTGVFSPLSTMRLLRYIKKFRPDVVHIHELHAYFLNVSILLRFLEKNNIPVVHTLHCEFSYTGKCGHADECEQWKTECKNCPKVREYPQSMFFDQTQKMFKKKKNVFSKLKKMIITTPSNWITERAKQSFLGNREIRTIYNGINTEIFCPQNSGDFIRRKYGISEQQKIVLSVAPNILSSRKGGEYVLRCANTLGEKGYFFILIGADEADKWNQKNVLVLPKIYDKELLAKFYSAADVFVLCSKKETFSLTCAEALCCGTPVVGFKCGAPEMIFPEPYAKFVEYGDIDALSTLITEITLNNIDAEEISKFSISRYSNDKMLESYYEIYRKIGE
ncbi:MAG: glycosyltransferase [Clostridia bacterium]|nr:glycosyltransferase [Clostridia bacterium]